MSAKIATVLPWSSFNIRTRAGGITSRRSAGSSNDTDHPDSTRSPRSSRRALTRMREKKPSIDSTPMRILPTGLALPAFEVRADFPFEALFDAFIGVKLESFNLPRTMAMVVFVGIVVTENPTAIDTGRLRVDQGG